MGASSHTGSRAGLFCVQDRATQLSPRQLVRCPQHARCGNSCAPKVHSVVLRAGMVFSFGSGGHGRLGLGRATVAEWEPQLVTADGFRGRIASVSAGVECSVVCASDQLYVTHFHPAGPPLTLWRPDDMMWFVPAAIVAPGRWVWGRLPGATKATAATMIPTRLPSGVLPRAPIAVRCRAAVLDCSRTTIVLTSNLPAMCTG